jgi:hypothetical protein
MNLTEFYNVVIHRKSQNAAVQLNYAHKGAAETAFGRVLQLADPTYEPTLTRAVLEDYFGARIALDRDDIGNVLFIDAVRNLEMQASSALLNAKEKAKLDREVAASPLLNGQLIAHPGAQRPM